MNTMELGTKLVHMVNAGEAEAFVAQYYAPDVVSIEGAEGEGMPARTEGLDAVMRKGEWWFANHEVHAMAAEGPFIGLREDQFAVRHLADATPKGGERTQMDEIALYTVRDGRIAEEAFLYRMG